MSKQSPEPMDRDELLKAVKHEVDRASEMQQERETNRKMAADYFYGRAPAPPDNSDGEIDENRADFVSTDVADAVEAVLAEIMPAFSGQAPVEFVPFGPDDELKADMETKAVTHVALANGMYMAMNMAVKDALLRRAGVIKVFWEKRARVVYEDIESIDPMMLPEMLAQQDPNELLDVMAGELDEQTGLVSGTVKRTIETMAPRIEAVPLDEFLIDGNVSMPVADEARFLAHQRPETRSNLISLGFDPELVYSLRAVSGADSGAAAVARARAASDTEFDTGHKSTEFVMAVEAYYNVDVDGDGIAELRRVVTAGGEDGTEELLLDEPWGEQPFCVGVPYLGLYSWDGVSLFDKLKSIQDSKSNFVRQLLDAGERNLQQRIGAVERQVNMDDLLTSVMGGVVRIKNPNSVVPLPSVEIPQSSFAILGYLDEARRDKGGGAIDTAAQAQAMAGDTAHGIERMMSAAEQVNAMVAKNLAETLLKPAYKKLHALLRQYWEGAIMMRSAGQWTQETPSQWSPREELVISMGMSVGERGRRTAALQHVLSFQQQAMQADQQGILVDLPQIYAAATDLVRMAGLPAPEQYFINPQSPEAQQAMEQKQQAAQQAAQAQQEQAQQSMQMQLQLSQIPLQMEEIKANAKLQSDQMANQLKSIQTALDQVNAAMDRRIRILELETKVDQADAAQEIDRMQAQDQAKERLAVMQGGGVGRMAGNGG